MPAKLVHHTPESANGGVSPFHTAIMEIVTCREARIACPFLGVGYLRRVVGCASSWRLLTDVEAWLASQTVATRAQVVEFILAHRERVHHCGDLHAKVVVGGDRALVGSANLTAKGIGRRIEMGVRLDDCEQVGQLAAWFDRLWVETGPVIEIELRACAASIPAPPSRAGASRLSGAAPKVRARLQGEPPASSGSPRRGALAGSTPVDPARPTHDVLSGKLGKRTNRIHDVMVAATGPLSPKRIRSLARCKAVSEHLLAMEKRGYAQRVGRGQWELTDTARLLVRRAGGG